MPHLHSHIAFGLQSWKSPLSNPVKILILWISDQISKAGCRGCLGSPDGSMSLPRVHAVIPGAVLHPALWSRDRMGGVLAASPNSCLLRKNSHGVARGGVEPSSHCALSSSHRPLLPLAVEAFTAPTVRAPPHSVKRCCLLCFL